MPSITHLKRGDLVGNVCGGRFKRGGLTVLTLYAEMYITAVILLNKKCLGITVKIGMLVYPRWTPCLGFGLDFGRTKHFFLQPFN